MASTYTIAKDGDVHERRLWASFAESEFRSYETFWQRRVVPLTHRPDAITLKSDAELAEIGQGPEDVAIAQLHYTCLLHLGSAHDLCSTAGWNREKLSDTLSRLVSATDVADELLQRNARPGCYDPWSEQDGRAARNEWRKTDKALQPLRAYRNRLIHGRVPLEINVSYGTGTVVRLPKFETVDDYLDWRRVAQARAMSDFDTPATLAKRAWRDVIEYVEDRWRRHLL